ncbi:MAG: tripartite tricarboxylate transporter TctB family protein [Rhodobacterales bacterium]|nr:tripartite tricarboxylate transporter TctB family protein [Rhodobacterales bacterium]
MQTPRKKRPGEGTFGILALVLSLGFAWQSYEIAGFSALSSPGAFPMAASAIMVVASLIIVLKNRRLPTLAEGGFGAAARAFWRSVSPPVVLAFIAFILVYSALLDGLGFLPSSFLFLLAAIHYLHRGSARFSFIVALLSLAAVYAVFRLIFTVVLPEGIVPEREIMAWIEHLFSGGAGR